jgi:hypothetical protein
MTTLANVIAWTSATPPRATVAPLNMPTTTLENIPCLAHVGTLAPGNVVLLLDVAGTPYIIGKLA